MGVTIWSLKKWAGLYVKFEVGPDLRLSTFLSRLVFGVGGHPSGQRGPGAGRRVGRRQ